MKISIVLLTIAMAVSCSSSGSDAAVGTVNNTNSVQAVSPSPSSAESTANVEVSSKEMSVNLIKGKAETTEDFGYLRAELISNGDYVFEVRNSTKKAIKASVKVTIENPAADSEEQ